MNSTEGKSGKFFYEFAQFFNTSHFNHMTTSFDSAFMTNILKMHAMSSDAI